MKYVFLWLLTGFSTLDLKAQSTLVDKLKTTQILVVTTENWNTTKGKLTLYELESGKWQPVLQDINIITGYSGMAWGSGLHSATYDKGKLKKEGDGNTPAGIFPLTGLYGYDDFKAGMDYLKVDEKTFCVDDVASKYYNKIVNTDTVDKDWKSAERMKLKSTAYKYGIFVGYNTSSTDKGKGSCIFIHINEDGKATSGCVAMKENDILKLIAALDKNKNPLVVQAPRAAYSRLKIEYKLP